MISASINPHLHTVSIRKCDIKRSLWLVPLHPILRIFLSLRVVSFSLSVSIGIESFTDSFNKKDRLENNHI